jgi:hypothetical protein
MTNSNSHCTLVGDYNIDLLKIKEKTHYHDYLLNMLSFGFYPQITLPTRFTDTSASLIDHVFSNISASEHECSAGILLSQISDHLPYFYCCKHGAPTVQNTKHVYNRDINEKTIASLKKYLLSCNIFDQLQNNTQYTPNDLYNKFENIISSVMDECLPMRKVKYNKYKHKKSKWITHGIINSIKYKDRLYKLLKKTNPNIPSYSTRKNNLKVYNNILKKLILEAKQKYYGHQFEIHKSNTKKTWKTINEILNNKEKTTIPDYITTGHETIKDKNIIGTQFQ